MILDKFRVDSQIAVVTGGTKGIGKAIVPAHAIIGATVFLASPASDFINGVVLPVDGGWLGEVQTLYLNFAPSIVTRRRKSCV